MNFQPQAFARSRNGFRAAASSTLALLLVLLAGRAFAYPPAPHHMFSGMVRDEYGSPIHVPDAWERMSNPDITAVNPGDDLDGDGLSNLKEYLAGTYAYDARDGFALVIKGLRDGAPVMQFTAIRGRTYTLVGSTDLSTWFAVPFRIPTDGPGAAARANYQAVEVRPVELEAVTAGVEPAPKFFKLMVQ